MTPRLALDRLPLNSLAPLSPAPASAAQSRAPRRKPDLMPTTPNFTGTRVTTAVTLSSTSTRRPWRPSTLVSAFVQLIMVPPLDNVLLLTLAEGCPTVATRNGWDIPLANFTVLAGDNHLSRPVGGGQVESGYLQGGEVKNTNLTLNTNTGDWEVIGFDQMFIEKGKN